MGIGYLRGDGYQYEHEYEQDFDYLGVVGKGGGKRYARGEFGRFARGCVIKGGKQGNGEGFKGTSHGYWGKGQLGKGKGDQSFKGYGGMVEGQQKGMRGKFNGHCYSCGGRGRRV